MKKNKNRSLIFPVISVLFYVAAMITFFSGNHNSTGIIWLCLGSTFLSIGTALSRKEKDKTDHGQ